MYLINSSGGFHFSPQNLFEDYDLAHIFQLNGERTTTYTTPKV